MFHRSHRGGTYETKCKNLIIACNLATNYHTAKSFYPNAELSNHNMQTSDVNRAAYAAACGRAVQRSNLFWRILPRANYEKFTFKF